MLGGYQKIVIFEPDPKCVLMLEKNVPHNNRIKIIQKGVWDIQTDVGFIANGNQASRVIENIKSSADDVGIEIISVTSIDECVECREATFIKMDLEGSELKALKGAEMTIKRNRPKLAICIYHSDEDMLRIIDYIHDLDLGYRLYVRHHSYSKGETVLYAI